MKHTIRDPRLWHLLIVVAVSGSYEWLFLHTGLSWFDEAWPLYAAMRLRAGGTLYDDTLFVFPPGHLLPAWIAQHLDPPGFVAARLIYAAFSTALCATLYLAGRRLMPARFALLGALLVAVAAPHSHYKQLLYGYRYLVLAVLALLAFGRRLSSGDARWMGVAGLATGVALCFRLTPAFSVACGIALAAVAAERDPRRWLRDGLWLGGGIAVVAAPVLAWLAAGVGLERLWVEIVVHPLAMLQPLPLPPLAAPDWSDRESISGWWTALRMRAGWLLYGGYAAALLGLWLRGWQRGEPFRHALLLAWVVFGGVFFVRSLGRSDEPHLDSVLPPLCVLAAHALWLASAALWRARPAGPRVRLASELALVGATLAAWVLLSGSDLYVNVRHWAAHRVWGAGDPIFVDSSRLARWMRTVPEILRRRTAPGDTILCMGPTPLFYLLSDRLGPGYRDIVIPGTFLSREEERLFVARLEAAPPAAVVWSERDFDRMPERALHVTAPLLSRWVLEHYRAPPRPQRGWIVLLPISDPTQLDPPTDSH